MLKELCKGDYLKLVGLFTLAHHHNKALREIEVAAAEIIQMESDVGNYYGHLSDALYEASIEPVSIDDTLRNLDITVKK